MPSAVLDTSVLIRVLVPSQYEAHAEALVAEFDRSGILVLLPSQVTSEAMAVIRQSVHDGRMTAAQGELAFLILRGFAERWEVPGTQWEAWNVATRYAQPATYDSEGYALAESLGADLWTADDRFVNAMQAHRPPWVHRLSDFDPATTI